MYTFDGPSRIVILDQGVTEFASSDLYSRWKEWVLAGNAQFVKAVEAVGGQATSPTNFVPSYFFMVNGWKIRPHEANHTLTVTGNLANESGVGSPFTSTIGDFNVLIQTNTSDSPTVDAGGGSGGDDDLYIQTGPLIIKI